MQTMPQIKSKLCQYLIKSSRSGLRSYIGRSELGDTEHVHDRLLGWVRHSGIQKVHSIHSISSQKFAQKTVINSDYLVNPWSRGPR